MQGDKFYQILKVFLLFLLLAILGGCYFLFVSKESYPISREITSKEGKQLEVTIVGREGNILHFDRRSDQRRFALSVENLSWTDRFWALRYPQQEPPKAIEKEEEETDQYILVRRNRIKELEQKISLYSQELNSGTLSSILQRQRFEQIQEMNEEIQALRVGIETYKWRTNQ